MAAGELSPPALVAAVGGPLPGVRPARFTLGPSGLHLLTGQADGPVPVVPWASIALVGVLFPAMVPVVVAAEAAARRRKRLAEVLRVGGA
ncbi:hypothetical protein MB27_12605 [Actinoplanes utahensis]|uniref:ABC transporter permease n=1 Tax=Actinoplanes utahensis TaxID=1869 RepID=A0A0A6XAZ1_ACTUT|nr:hypothetical protein MB27_12605 [Actinoplanes utahensis]